MRDFYKNMWVLEHLTPYGVCWLVQTFVANFNVSFFFSTLADLLITFSIFFRDFFFDGLLIWGKRERGPNSSLEFEN